MKTRGRKSTSFERRLAYRKRWIKEADDWLQYLYDDMRMFDLCVCDNN